MSVKFSYRILLGASVLFISIYCSLGNRQNCRLRTPDWRAYLLFNKQEYKTAAETFHNPMWKGAALYRDGEFKKASEIFSGFDTAEGIYNYGNSLLMQGQYERAIDCYNRTLAMIPDWDDAQVNLAIAVDRAKKTKKEGGNMTDGKLGADEFTFSKVKNDDNSWEEPDVGDTPNDAAMRAIWLRQVQTKPADFLAAKFSYQNAMKSTAE